MKINKVTITGADNNVNYDNLITLQKKYPFVEWGILFSKNKVGQQRYPSEQHIKNEFINDLILSAHFCGWYSKEVLENQNFNLITSLPKQFNRVQINYNFKNSKGWNLDKLIEFMFNYKDKNIILQYNGSNESFLNEILNNDLPDNVHFLYDGSGGRGTEIKVINNPIDGYYTGYSGGLSTENIDSICGIINKIKNDTKVWIDMESGVRTNNELDLDKVKLILEKTSKYINN